MRRLLKYIKPYTLFVVLSIILLFFQAFLSLALPDYLSKIVNNGIQQNGVEHAVPEAIRKSEMENLLIFMSVDDQEQVLNYYEQIEPGFSNGEQYIETYPVLRSEAIYILKKVNQKEIELLTPIMGKAFVVTSSIRQLIEDPTKATPVNEVFDFDPSIFPADIDLEGLIEMMPSDQILEMRAASDEVYEAVGGSMINQMAVGFVKSEYEALGMDIGKLQTDYLKRTGGVMLLISILGGFSTIAVGYFSSKTSAGFSRDIRRAVFRKVESFSNVEFDKFSTASLITRSTNDVSQVQAVIFMIIRMVFFAPIIGIGAVIRAVDKSPDMWWIIAAAVVSLLILILIIFSITLPKIKIVQSLTDKLNLVIREHLSGMMVIRAFNKQEDESKRFDKANRDLMDTNLFIARVMIAMSPLMAILMSGLSLGIIWIGAHQIAQATMQVGDMMAFLQYAMQVVMSFMMMSMMFIMLPQAAVSGDRIAEVLDTEISIKDVDNPTDFKDGFSGLIEFRNVSFRYPGAIDDVLHDINFTARSGETTALIGSTGCGKSTLVNLIPRFYDVSKGGIFLDGIDVQQVRQSDLRDKIGFVPQKGMLFSGTIESNLLYADQNATMETLDDSIQIAQVSEFVSSKEDGYKSEIAQGGSNVSGGQKQRLAIARALVKKPPIYIFDDSFSSLDFKTDSALRRELKKKTGDSTVLIVTQRVATVKNVDQIIVLDKGQVVGKGKHQDLMKTCEIYHEIAKSQLSMEELT